MPITTPLFGLTLAPVRVRVRLIHNSNGGARFRVSAPYGTRTVAYDHSSRDPFLTAIVLAFGGDEGFTRRGKKLRTEDVTRDIAHNVCVFNVSEETINRNGIGR